MVRLQTMNVAFNMTELTSDLLVLWRAVEWTLTLSFRGTSFPVYHLVDIPDDLSNSKLLILLLPQSPSHSFEFNVPLLVLLDFQEELLCFYSKSFDLQQ